MAVRGRSGDSVMESENQRLTEDLQQKVARLKNIAIDIDSEAKEQNRYLNSMDTDFDSGTSLLSGSVARFSTMVQKSRGNRKLMCYLVLGLMAKRTILQRVSTGVNRNFLFLKEMFTNPLYPVPLMSLLILLESVLCYFIVEKVKYTEIDWNAYMQEVGGFINGSTNYKELKGSTGPLVYPAGFVYIFSILYNITDMGRNIRLGQYIFIALYLLNLLLLFNIYRRVRIVPPWVFLFMCFTSYRVHSIYLLRMFNDPVAMFLVYLAINMFIYDFWTFGCIIFSIAVSVKMNILLFAPGLGLLLLARKGFWRTVWLVLLMSAIQVFLGYPFLVTNPTAYLVRAFDLGRRFKYKWTVNWKCIPRHIFRSRYFHFSLLVGHLTTLFLFVFRQWGSLFGGISMLFKGKGSDEKLSPRLICFMLMSSNFLGICWARSLHYQFYVWYYHSLPFLFWSLPLPNTVRLLLWGLIEMSWNTYPATFNSSLLLQCAHFSILLFLYFIYLDNITRNKQDEETKMQKID